MEGTFIFLFPEVGMKTRHLVETLFPLCRPLCALVQCVDHQQHLCVSVLEPVGPPLSASVHGSAVVSTEAAGL